MEKRYASLEEMESRAAIIDVNESLQHKANKESVGIYKKDLVI